MADNSAMKAGFVAISAMAPIDEGSRCTPVVRLRKLSKVYPMISTNSSASSAWRIRMHVMFSVQTGAQLLDVPSSSTHWAEPRMLMLSDASGARTRVHATDKVARSIVRDLLPRRPTIDETLRELER
jgi:hypothetical protein